MSEVKNSRPYDLEERTFKFAKDVMEFASIPSTKAVVPFTLSLSKGEHISCSCFDWLSTN